MEAVVKRWAEAEAEVEEEVSLLKRQVHMHIDAKATANDDIQVCSGLNNGGPEFSQQKVNSGDEEWVVSTENLSVKTENIEKNIILPATDPPISETGRERAVISMEYKQGVQELHLEKVYQKPPTQGFYCPNCMACIEKVLIQDMVREEEEPSVHVPPPPPDTLRCASCFGFLIPLGRVILPALASKKYDPSDNKDPGSNFKTNIKLPDSSIQTSEIPRDDQVQDVSRKKPSYLGAITSALALARLKKPKTHVSEDSTKHTQLDGVIVDEPDTAPSAGTAVDTTTQEGAVEEPGSSKTWDFLKSLVYGGLIESIASLGVVTSSASAGATTLNIVALSIANLIGGLFILVHHIWDLKSELPSSTTQIDTSADRYYQSLGYRKNFFLHLSVAILSFLIFGLVPPLVYGFSFYESDSTDLKLAVVAGASVVCIALLAVAKAYVQRPTTYLTYFKTVFYYLSTGAVASVVAYLVGVLIKKLVEKLGWFESSSSFNLFLPEMSIEKTRFGSY